MAKILPIRHKTLSNQSINNHISICKLLFTFSTSMTFESLEYVLDKHSHVMNIQDNCELLTIFGANQCT